MQEAGDHLRGIEVLVICAGDGEMDAEVIQGTAHVLAKAAPSAGVRRVVRAGLAYASPATHPVALSHQSAETTLLDAPLDCTLIRAAPTRHLLRHFWSQMSGDAELLSLLHAIRTPWVALADVAAAVVAAVLAEQPLPGVPPECIVDHLAPPVSAVLTTCLQLPEHPFGDGDRNRPRPSYSHAWAPQGPDWFSKSLSRTGSLSTLRFSSFRNLLYPSARTSCALPTPPNRSRAGTAFSRPDTDGTPHNPMAGPLHISTAAANPHRYAFTITGPNVVTGEWLQQLWETAGHTTGPIHPSASLAEQWQLGKRLEALERDVPEVTNHFEALTGLKAQVLSASTDRGPDRSLTGKGNCLGTCTSGCLACQVRTVDWGPEFDSASDSEESDPCIGAPQTSLILKDIFVGDIKGRDTFDPEDQHQFDGILSLFQRNPGPAEEHNILSQLNTILAPRSVPGAVTGRIRPCGCACTCSRCTCAHTCGRWLSYEQCSALMQQLTTAVNRLLFSCHYRPACARELVELLIQPPVRAALLSWVPVQQTAAPWKRWR